MNNSKLLSGKNVSNKDSWLNWLLSFIRAQKYLYVLIVIASGAILISDWKNIKNIFPTETPIITSRYDWPAGKAKAEIQGDWKEAPMGLALDPGGSGNIVFEVKKEKEEGATFILSFFSFPGLDNEISLSLNKTDYTTIAKNFNFAKYRIDVSKYVKGVDTFWLRLSAKIRAYNTFNKSTVLENIQINTIKNPIFLPDIHILFFLIIIPILLFCFSKTLFSNEIFSFIFSLFILAGEILIKYFWPGFLIKPIIIISMESYFTFPFFVYFFILLIYLFVYYFFPQFGKSNSQLTQLILLGIIALALNLRWGQLFAIKYSALPLDVQTYKDITLQMSHPFDTNFREPLWIWVLKIWLWIFGSADLSIRLLTVLFSLLVIIISFKFFKDYTNNNWLALLVSFFLSVNGYFIFMSPRGYRLELYTCSVILFCYFAFVSSEILSDKLRLAGLTVFVALLELIQINSFIFTLPFLLYGFWKHSINYRKIFVPILITLIFLAPYLSYSYFKFGDPFYSINKHAVWYRNKEFKTNCQGCPTARELEVDSYSGLKVNSFQYFLKMHRLKDVLLRTMNGYYIVFLKNSYYLQSEIGVNLSVFYYLYLAGLILVIFSRYRGLIIIALFLINLLAFFVPTTKISPRILAHASPFFTFFLAYGIWVPLAFYHKTISKIMTKS